VICPSTCISSSSTSSQLPILSIRRLSQLTQHIPPTKEKIGTCTLPTSASLEAQPPRPPHLDGARPPALYPRSRRTRHGLIPPPGTRVIHRLRHTRPGIIPQLLPPGCAPRPDQLIFSPLPHLRQFNIVLPHQNIPNAFIGRPFQLFPRHIVQQVLVQHAGEAATVRLRNITHADLSQVDGLTIDVAR
jgi:hypothetical protein